MPYATILNNTLLKMIIMMIAKEHLCLSVVLNIRHYTYFCLISLIFFYGRRQNLKKKKKQRTRPSVRGLLFTRRPGKLIKAEVCLEGHRNKVATGDPGGHDTHLEEGVDTRRTRSAWF